MKPGRFTHWLDRDPARVVNPAQKYGNSVFRKVLVDRAPSSLPVAIVVDNEHATGSEEWEEMGQFMLRGLVPIRIET